MGLLRVLIPSWKFFDKVGTKLILEQRTRESGVPSQWSEALPPRSAAGNRLLLNPAGNFRLAAQSLVDRLADEGHTSPDELEASVTYGLVKNIVQQKTQGKAFQFRILASHVGATPDEIYLSQWQDDSETEC